MRYFNPYNWYWLADDGRVFSSARSVNVSETDPDYIEWKNGDGEPQVWPRDEHGHQTPAELQRTLFSYQIPVDLKAYAFYLRDQTEKSGTTVDVPPITEIRTDDYTQNLIARYQQVATENNMITVAWVMPDRSTTILNAAKINTLFSQLMTFIFENYNTYSAVIADIDNGSITNLDQIDQAFGTKLTRQTKIDIGWRS
jgi:hypothetical protein